MPALDNIRLLIEALRGGNSPESAIAAQKSQRSTYNPQGIPYTAPAQAAPTGPLNPNGMSTGLRDPEYLKYTKTTSNPKPYMVWLEEGG